MFEKFIPTLQWTPNNCKKSDLNGDMLAGLIVTITLIPQGMAYAMLAGLPSVVGLYAATIIMIVYALFGTSCQLAVGSVYFVCARMNVNGRNYFIFNGDISIRLFRLLS